MRATSRVCLGLGRQPLQHFFNIIWPAPYPHVLRTAHNAVNQRTKITKYPVYVFGICFDTVVGPTDVAAQALYFSCMMSSGSKYFILNT